MCVFGHAIKMLTVDIFSYMLVASDERGQGHEQEPTAGNVTLQIQAIIIIINNLLRTVSRLEQGIRLITYV